MEAFVGEIRYFGFDFAPQGWAKCDGAMMSIKDNSALFSLLGVRFGGDGASNFALPNLPAAEDAPRACICLNGLYPQHS